MKKPFQKGARAFVLLWWLIQCYTSVIQPVHGCLGYVDHDVVEEGCACNFMGACSLDSKNEYNQSFKGNLTTYFPDVKLFAKKSDQVVTICEPGKIGIIYDCQNRIPLASTIVLTETQYKSEYSTKKRKRGFDDSLIIHPDYRQSANDYKGSLKHVPCYRNKMGKRFYDRDWYRALTGESIGIQVDCGSKAKTRPATIHRGHLIAAQYGRADRVKQTFVYTNVVPQFGTLNSGAWSAHESFLIKKWAPKHCNGLPIHIIVGTVPSTSGLNQPRFFGKAGFSDYQETSKAIPNEHFAINIPAFMWTVACCGSGSDFNNTGFFAQNLPERGLVHLISPNKLLEQLRIEDKNFNFFPNAQGNCENDDNYITF